MCKKHDVLSTFPLVVYWLQLLNNKPISNIKDKKTSNEKLFAKICNLSTFHLSVSKILIFSHSIQTSKRSRKSSFEQQFNEYVS